MVTPLAGATQCLNAGSFAALCTRPASRASCRNNSAAGGSSTSSGTASSAALPASSKRCSDQARSTEIALTESE